MIQFDQSEPTRDLRVLHIDDEVSHLDLSKAFLEMVDEDMAIESVASSKEALKLLKSETYDCVVSDFQMPDLDGIELAKRIREFSDVPIILYTGRGSEEVAETAFTAGVDDYIRKEINPRHYQVLARRIRVVVVKKRAHCSCTRVSLTRN